MAEAAAAARSRGAAAVHPFIYEINTWSWLDHLSRGEERHVDLASVPEARWDAIAERGFDLVWLMGVWQRSPLGVAIALDNPGLVESFRAALPDYCPADVVGSPYCIREYVVDARLGGPDGLAVARHALAERGLGLVLDFVPNHVAPDHPWTALHPEFFVRGTRDDLASSPTSFVEVAGQILANGRDPYFPAWPDVVQLNAFSPALRSAVIDTLRSIADQSDGVRCDMAMLTMNDVFARTWGTRAGDRPAEDYWERIIPAVHQTHPHFRLIAEAYWGMEWALQQQGFDFAYDKQLYDRLLHEGAAGVRGHLLADRAYQDKLVRFIENHDEPRSASVFEPDREMAAAVTTLTQTGARLVHDGQIEGRQVHLPVFLGRFPEEAPDAEVEGFYTGLLAALGDETFRTGTWRLCEHEGWPGNDSFQHLVAWCWAGHSRWLVVVNLSGATATGHVRAPWADLRGQTLALVDPTNDTSYERSGDELCDGLYVELGPWRWHLFRLEPR